MRKRYIVIAILFIGVLASINADPGKRDSTEGVLERIDEFRLGKDNAPMRFIPAGEFRMGSSDRDARLDEKPVHTVYIDAFYMDVYEVTVEQYKQFLRATGHRALPKSIVEYSPTDRHPVVGVSWHDAMAYARWAEKRLPTEAEWEKAARGGLAGKKYPWGNGAPNGTQCNCADKNGENWPVDWDADYWDKNINDGYTYAAPIGSFPPNGYGLYDMAGNVREWCLDEYTNNFYTTSPHRNPIAGVSIINNVINSFLYVKSLRVLRGGSWNSSLGHLRVTDSVGVNPTGTDSYGLGFRYAKDYTP